MRGTDVAPRFHGQDCVRAIWLGLIQVNASPVCRSSYCISGGQGGAVIGSWFPDSEAEETVELDDKGSSLEL